MTRRFSPGRARLEQLPHLPLRAWVDFTCARNSTRYHGNGVVATASFPLFFFLYIYILFFYFFFYLFFFFFVFFFSESALTLFSLSFLSFFLFLSSYILALVRTPPSRFQPEASSHGGPSHTPGGMRFGIRPNLASLRAQCRGGKTPSSISACRWITRWRMLISSTRTVARPIADVPVRIAPVHWKCWNQMSLRGWNRRVSSPETGSSPAMFGPLWLLQ